MSSTDSDQEWLQFVEEVQLSSPAASSGGGGGGGKPSLAASTDHHQRLFSPKGCISKSVRRRSRAPRRTPATHLTANAINFRSLVQKFTGRPTTPLSSTSHRGPLTLNGTQQYNIHPFGSDYHHHHHQQEFFPADDTSIITSDVLLSAVSDGRNSQGGFTMENISLEGLSTVDCFSAGLNTDDIGYFW